MANQLQFERECHGRQIRPTRSGSGVDADLETMPARGGCLLPAHGADSDHASDARPAGGRPDAAPARRAYAAAHGLCARRRDAAVHDSDTRGDVHRAGDVHDRRACRATTASSPTAGCSATSWRYGCGGSRTGWLPARRSGTRASGAIRRSRAPICSGGTTWRPRTTSASRRGRSTRPTGASCRTATRSLRSCARSSRSELGRVSAVPVLGTRDVDCRRRAGSPKPRCMSGARARRR